MPPQRKRQHFVIVVDQKSDRAFVKNVITDVLVNKSLLESNDLAEVFLHYENVTSEPLSMGCDAILTLFDEAEPCNDENFDWRKALKKGASAFEKWDIPAIFTFQLLFITDFTHATPSAVPTNDELEAIFSQFDIRLTVVVKPNKITYGDAKSITMLEDIGDAMENINIDNASEECLKCIEFAKLVRGVVTDPKNVLDFISFQANPLHKQDWLVPLTLGTYTFITKTRKIIDKEPTVCRKTKPKGEIRYNRVPAWNEEAGISTALSKEDVTKASNFHGTYLTMPQDVRDSFKAETKRCFKIVGFVDRDKLPEIYFGGSDTFCVTADTTSERTVVFCEFVDRLLALNKIALAVRVYNDRNKPRIFVLLPQEGHWFLMTNLVESVTQFFMPVSPPCGETAPSTGMTALRQQLISKRPLFHPTSELGPHRKLLLNNVRKYVGFQSKSYQDVGQQSAIVGSVEVIPDLEAALVNEFPVDPPVGTEVTEDSIAAEMDDDTAVSDEEW